MILVFLVGLALELEALDKAQGHPWSGELSTSYTETKGEGDRPAVSDGRPGDTVTLKQGAP